MDDASPDVESKIEISDDSQKEGERMKAFLSWKDLRLTVDGKRHILQGLSGCAEPGRLLAIMGPSGSGKSTLLETIAGRPSRDAIVTGDILVNGQKANLSYGNAAYLAQDVPLLGTLTVYETLYYSAKLRFKDGTSESKTKRLVMCSIEDVGLVDSLHTPIGNWFRRGLSGGEKRRLSIAIELITSPTLIFLDEPTSGLDSASSFHLIRSLRELAQAEDRTILCSIHQPSGEIFELFDDLCLLSDGQQVYYGPRPQALQFFERTGYPCPQLRSPSDHYLHCINSDFDRVERDFIKRQKTSSPGGLFSARENTIPGKSAKQVVAELTQAYKLCDEKKFLDHNIDNFSNMDSGYYVDKGKSASFLKQSFHLTIRSSINMYRDIGYFSLRMVMYILMCVCIGTLYFDIGYSYRSIQDRASAFTFVVGFLTFMAITGFPSFIEDIKVFETERLNGHYRVGAFVVANSLSSMPFLFIITVVSTSIVYPLAKFNAGPMEFLYFLLAVYASLLVSEAMMMAVSSLVPQFLLGIIVGAGLQATFILDSGFYKLPDRMPGPIWIYPTFYLNYVAYAFQGIMQNEFHDKSFEGMNPGDPPLTGDDITAVVFEIAVSRSKWWDLVILCGMFVGYRLIFFTLLKCRENIFPQIGSLTFAKWMKFRAKISLYFETTSKKSESSGESLNEISTLEN